MSTSNQPQFQPLPRSVSLRDDVATTLIASIINGDLKQNDRLIVQKVAESLHVSATPVREALVQLSEIDLVDLIPNKGAVCNAFGPKQLTEIFQVRRILEVEAIRCACGKMDPVTLREMKSQWQIYADEEPDLEGWSETIMLKDQALHRYITDHCGSTRLVHEIQRYNTLMQEIRRFAGNQHNSQLRALYEHVQILDALIDEDCNGAAAAMGLHIDNAAKGVAEIMFPESNSSA